MFKLLNLSWKTIKNILQSKQYILGTILCFIYSAIWIFFIQPGGYDINCYNFEFLRMLYIGIVYLSFLVLANDIEHNTTKTIFSGVFTRTEIMISKIISLILLGVIVWITTEVNGLFAALSIPNKLGIESFIHLNHLRLLIALVATTFTIGALAMGIVSITYETKITVVVGSLILGVVNFLAAAFVVTVNKLVEVPTGLYIFTKTPFYITSELMNGSNLNGVLVMICWGIAFSIISLLIMNKREIK